jgi:hypothetical protein
MISNRQNKEPLEAIGNLWDHLTELSRSDPSKYKEVISQSASEYAKLKSAPLPNTCFHINEKVKH